MAANVVLSDLDLDPSACRTIVINGRSTTLSLDPNMWDALLEIGQRERLPMLNLVSLVAGRLSESWDMHEIRSGGFMTGVAPRDAEDDTKAGDPRAVALTTAIRVFIVNYFRRLAYGTASPDDGQGRHHADTDDGANTRVGGKGSR